MNELMAPKDTGRLNNQTIFFLLSTVKDERGHSRPEQERFLYSRQRSRFDEQGPDEHSAPRATYASASTKTQGYWLRFQANDQARGLIPEVQ